MRGFNGAMDGSPNSVVLRAGQANEIKVEDTAFEMPISAGDVILADLGGGGGWGDPLERDPSAVLDDVIDGYVSLDAARKHYGVVIEENRMKLDLEGTGLLRERLLQERAERKQETRMSVRYLSEEWQRLCEEAVNSDPGFADLAGDMNLELNNIIEDCPDGRARFLYWRFESGRLVKTVVGEIGEMGDIKRFFTTMAAYDTFMKINTAKLSVETAVINGLLRFEGDLAGMMAYAEALSRFTEVRRAIPTEY